MARRIAHFRHHLMLLCARLVLDQRGSMAIEVAVLGPVLLTMSLGAFEIGSMVSRQTELQTASAEAAAIVRASTPTTSQERATIRSIMMTSANLPSDNVSVVEIYRCAAATSYVTSEADCAANTVVNKFIRLTMTENYQPIWTQFGVGTSMSFRVVRTIQVG